MGSESKHEDCEKAAIIDEMHKDHKSMVERIHAGDMHFQELDAHAKSNGEKLDTLIVANREMTQRLFIDNGRKSFQTLLDRNSRFVAVSLWMGGVCFAGVAGLLIKAVWSTVTTANGG